MNEELLILCENFVNDHPLDDEMFDSEGRLDAQYFYETVPEEYIINFFEELYALLG